MMTNAETIHNLTEEEYLRVEQLYIDTVIDLFRESGCKKIKMYF